MSLRASFSLIVVIVAFLGSGCAQRMSPQQYQKQLTAADAVRSSSLNAFGKADPDDLAFFERSATKVDKSADELADIAPPSDIEAAHERYVASLRGLSRVFGKFADCARLAKSKPAQAADCRREIDQAALDQVQNDFDEAAAVFKEQGYSLGS